MVQVDVFWGYAWGASLAVACGRQLARRENPLDSQFWASTLIFLSLFWAPTGLLLLLRHPSWETMQAAQDLSDIPIWLILAFGITNITQGMLGFWVGLKLIKRGHELAAQLNWIAGYFGMFFILLYGWDGLGYDRFLYDRDLLAGSPAWTPGTATDNGTLAAITHFALNFSTTENSASVITTLLTDGLWLIPPFIWLFVRWLQGDARAQGLTAPGLGKIISSYLAGVFVIGLGGAALCAIAVATWAELLGAGAVIWHEGFYAPQNLGLHLLAYPLGLACGLTVCAWLLRPGKPLHAILRPLMLSLSTPATYLQGAQPT